MSELEIRTCSDSLLDPGKCCVCRKPATVAVLTADLTEHTRCQRHIAGVASKPLVWSPDWAPSEENA